MGDGGGSSRALTIVRLARTALNAPQRENGLLSVLLLDVMAKVSPLCRPSQSEGRANYFNAPLTVAPIDAGKERMKGVRLKRCTP